METTTRDCRLCGAAFKTRVSPSRAGRGVYCSRACQTSANRTHHGHAMRNAASATYNTWAAMRARCSNPNAPNYARYGGRGIRVCHAWQASFPAFLADMGERPLGHTLDRIDTNGNYEPSNCRWLPKAKQQQNLRTNRRIAFRGRTLCLSEWGREMGLAGTVISYRLKAGWTLEAALTTPTSEGCRRRPEITAARRRGAGAAPA